MAIYKFKPWQFRIFRFDSWFSWLRNVWGRAICLVSTQRSEKKVGSHNIAKAYNKMPFERERVRHNKQRHIARGRMTPGACLKELWFLCVFRRLKFWSMTNSCSRLSFRFYFLVIRANYERLRRNREFHFTIKDKTPATIKFCRLLEWKKKTQNFVIKLMFANWFLCESRLLSHKSTPATHNRNNSGSRDRKTKLIWRRSTASG